MLIDVVSFQEHLGIRCTKPWLFNLWGMWNTVMVNWLIVLIVFGIKYKISVRVRVFEITTWKRQTFRSKQNGRHYLNLWWPILLVHKCVTRLQWVNNTWQDTTVDQSTNWIENFHPNQEVISKTFLSKVYDFTMRLQWFRYISQDICILYCNHAMYRPGFDVSI